MAVNLIRKNNGVGITAYQDAVLFHLAKGENGVIADVHDEFSTTYNNTTKKLIVSSGMGIAYGRQFEIKPGENVEFDLTSLGTATKYITIYAEVDLRDPTDEVVSMKATYSDSAYAQITEGDNLISTPNGLYRILLFHVLKNSSSATITPRYDLLLSDTIDHARLADEADHAEDSNTINGVKIHKDLTTNRLMADNTDIIERKRVIYESTDGILIHDGTTFSLSEALSDGEYADLMVMIGSTKQMLRLSVGYINYADERGFRIMGFSSGTTWNSGLSFYCGTIAINGTAATCKPGWYVLNFLNDGGSNWDNCNITLYKIYKIIGGV